MCYNRLQGASNMKNSLAALFTLTLVVLAACAPQAAPPATLPAVTPAPMNGGQPVGLDQVTGVDWQWSQLQETQPPSQSNVPPGQNYVLTLAPDGTFSFTADCNSGSGTYTSSDTNLTLTLGPTTLAACGPDSLSNNFVSLLGGVTSFGMNNGALILTTNDGASFMGFAAPTETVAAAVEVTSPSSAPDPASVTLDTQGVFPAYQVKVVPPGDFDPGRAGLPEHTQVTFGQPVSPILYIIPVGQYEKMWDANQEPLVSSSLAKLQDLLTQKPTPFNNCCMPVLPVESAGGRNDVVAQGTYLPIKMGDGLRFVGRFAQDASPVANGQFYYVFQGLSSDQRYFISLFYPVTSSKLPDISQVPQSEFTEATQDPQGYAGKKAQELNALGPDDFSPSLTSLDTLIASLQFAPSP
jgi:heat shock protein HslJ